MKKISYLLSLCVLTFSACHKKDTPTPPPAPPTATETSTAIGKQLSATDSLSSFNSAFKTSTLSDQDVSGGVTIFAPANSAFGGSPAPTGEMLPDSSVLKDYIVKGLLKATDLTAGKTLTTLSGKTLTITVNGSIVQVNGVAINVTTPYTGTNFILYSASRLLNAAAPLSFTVWDATQWSASTPKGVTAAGASVALYNSQADYASGSKALYTVQTGNDGVATFNGIKPGNYYVVASKGAINNVFSVYVETYNDAYLGYAADTVIDNQGKIVWKDLNQDGIVNAADMGPVPALQAQAGKDLSKGSTILLGYVTKPLQSAVEAQTILNSAYASFLSAYYNMVAIDGVLSDDADCSAQTSFCPFDNFSFTALQPQVQSIVLNAYSQFGPLNRIVNDVPAMNIAADQKADLIAQAKGLRGYIYLQMLSYFGDLPIQKDITPQLYPGITRSTSVQVYETIVSDLTAAAASLPVTRTDSKKALTKGAALGLLAKAALWKKDYAAVADYTSQIISSSNYSLALTDSWFTAGDNTETIWAPAFSAIGANISWFYSGVFSVPVQVCPVLRYGQVLLMHAEAQINLGHYSDAQTDLNLLLTRRSAATVSITNASDGYTALQSTWQTEMLRQGDRFTNLVRWGLAAPVLGPKGYQPGKNNLLPIPLSLLSLYPGLTQNPGY
jgi:uncharacterized surface protein with fasciclin (FAS1) repeats